jgi:hypothetical protein
MCAATKAITTKSIATNLGSVLTMDCGNSQSKYYEELDCSKESKFSFGS